jgi:hypothetical protein
MTKKIFAAALVMFITAGALFAQESGRAKNTAALSLSLFAMEASYERQLTSHFSVSLDAAYTWFFLVNHYSATARGRWYPGRGVFFLELGLGYGYGTGIYGGIADLMAFIFTFGLVDIEEYTKTGGFLVGPALGWKFDIGKPDGFVLPLTLGLDIKTTPYIPDLVPYLRLGLGYSF